MGNYKGYFYGLIVWIITVYAGSYIYSKFNPNWTMDFITGLIVIIAYLFESIIIDLCVDE